MYILFDFDGTLVNSFNCVMEKTILLADECNYRKIQPHEIDRMRDLSSVDVIKFLGIPFYRIPYLIMKLRKHLKSEMRNLAPVVGIKDLIETLYRKKYTAGILTSNSFENVSTWLKLNGLKDYFSFIHTESRLFSKSALLKKVIKKYHIDAEDSYYICDETRDIEAASKNGVKSMAVTWGYHSEKTLAGSNPSFLARKPDDILQCLDIKVKEA